MQYFYIQDQCSKSKDCVIHFLNGVKTSNLVKLHNHFDLIIINDRNTMSKLVKVIQLSTF